MSESHFKTRFCPSPTGLIHLGNVRTALFNYLYAMHIGGTFLLRIEDTDVERSKVEFDVGLQTDCLWLGLNWQEGPDADEGNGPYRQSKRQAIYDDYYKRLEAAGTAYPCFCSEEQLALMRKVQRAAGKPPRYAGTCRDLTSAEVEAKVAAGEKPTLRFRVPENDTVVFNDMVRGEQKFNTGDIGDFIIRRANGTAPFMYCNAIDDAMMGVTHALRGEDHLTNTPRQIMILDAVGLTAPTYGHIALIVSPDGSPLSKRHGSKSIQECRELGYLPQAITNYLARLGHYYKEEGFMSLAELASAFKTESLSKSPAKFNLQQLNYWQKEAVMRLSYDDMWNWLGDDIKAMVPGDKQKLFIETIQPNVIFPNEALAWVDIFIKASELTFEDDKQKAFLQEAGAAYFDAVIEAYLQHAADYQPFIGYIKEKAGVKGKALFMPLRLALTGLTHGPELPKILALMEPDLIKQRLQEARDGK